MVERLPEFGDHVDQPLTIDQFFRNLQQVHHHGRADFGQVKEFSRVEPDDACRVQVEEPIAGLVEHPAERSALAPAAQPLVEAVLARLRQVLAHGREAAQRRRHHGHRLDGIGDGAFVGRQQRQCRRFKAHPDQLGPELKPGRCRITLQRVAAGGLAGL